jgi:hypothetical protein
VLWSQECEGKQSRQPAQLDLRLLYPSILYFRLVCPVRWGVGRSTLGVGRFRFQPSHRPRLLSLFRIVLRQRRISHRAWGNALGTRSYKKSACPVGHQIRAAMPHALTEIEPLALNRGRVTKLGRITDHFLWYRNAPSNAPTPRLIAPSFSPSRGRDAF